MGSSNDHRFAAAPDHVRLNSAIGYLTPADKLNGLAQVIFDERDRKLEEACQRRPPQRPRPMGRHEAALSFTPPIGIGIKALNLRGRMPRLPQQESFPNSLTSGGQNSSSR